MTRGRKKLAIVLGMATILLGAGGIVLWQRESDPKPVTGKYIPGETPEQRELFDEEAAFWEKLEAQKPVFHKSERKCFVEGKPFKVSTGDSKQDNAFGGVTTDLMKIALSPPPKRPGRPHMDLQNYDQLLSTCPTCGATYFEIDLVNIASNRPPGAAEKLKKFNLVELAPELAKKPKEKWTYDEQALARYLTQQTAGLPDYELGYTALSGAYSSNVSLGLGRDYSIPATAFYALAAAQFKHHIDNGKYDSEQAASLIAMTQGEMYRLLARQSDARQAYAKARELGGLDAQTAEIMKKLDALNEKGDYSLQLAPLEGMEEPPIGWYVYRILPAINADLEYERENWASLDDPEAIVAKIRERLKQ